MSAAVATWLKATHTSDDVERIVAGIRRAAGGRVDVVAQTVPAGRAKAWLDGLSFALEHGVYPPDQDLRDEDRWRFALVPAEVDDRDGRRILQDERQAYGEPCEVVLLCVPPGLGSVFIASLKERLNAGVVGRCGNCGQITDRLPCPFCSPPYVPGNVTT